MKKNLLKLGSFVSLLAFTPALAFAADCFTDNSIGSSPKVGDLFNYGTCIIDQSVIPLIFAVAVVMFVWGVVQFVINSDDEAKKAKGRQFMIWGIIALTVMVGVWGLVGILGGTFNLPSGLPHVTPPIR